MSLKFGKSTAESVNFAPSKRPTNHYKWVSMVLGLLLATGALGAIYGLNIKNDMEEKIGRYIRTIDDGAKEKQGLKDQIKSLTIANQEVIDDLKQDNNDKIAAFAKQAASCDEIKKRYGFK